MIRGNSMRRTEPLDVNELWLHPLPMPMPNQPVCATELQVIEQLNKIPITPRIFIWTDSERRCTQGWEFLASVRQGVPPQGIEAELVAWCEQYPDAWLIVDMRDGVIPPSTSKPLADVLTSIGRQVIVMVSSSSNNPEGLLRLSTFHQVPLLLKPRAKASSFSVSVSKQCSIDEKLYSILLR